VQAIDSLSGRFERMEYCVEMAEWMIQTGLSKKDSNDVLMAAVDAFMAVEETAHPGMAGGELGALDEDASLDGDDDDLLLEDGTESMRSNFDNGMNTGHSSRTRLGTANTLPGKRPARLRQPQDDAISPLTLRTSASLQAPRSRGPGRGRAWTPGTATRRGRPRATRPRRRRPT
jgi:hypothetical protein